MPMRMCRKKNTPALQVGSKPHWKAVWWFLRKLYSLMSGYYPRSSEHQDTIHRPQDPEKKEDQSVSDSVLLRGGTKYRSKYGDKVWSRDWRKGHPETAPPVYPSHVQSTNPDVSVDADKCLLTGAWYGHLIRDPARSLQGRGRCSQPIIGLCTGSPMEETEKGLNLLKGFATP